MEYSLSRCLVIVKSLRLKVHKNVSKSGALERSTCSPKWPNGYRTQTRTPYVRRK